MKRLASAVAVLAVALTVGSCATGKDAVVVGGQFEFVAPGGQQTILYDPPSVRGAVTSFSGESLTDPDKQIGIQDYPGKVVVINVWGSWCGPCRAEVNDLQLVADQLGPQGVAVLGLDVRDARAAASDFVRDRHLTYQSIFDPAGRALLGLAGYPRNVVPSTIVLDRDHRVAAVYLTRLRLAEFMRVAQRIATEPAAP
ncbi:MAG: TlpA family protein disulfide reductase [Pseudonocardia sp.]|nr:TlpA family protein disulfide reductase [Pseudonocardia sp.]